MTIREPFQLAQSNRGLAVTLIRELCGHRSIVREMAEQFIASARIVTPDGERDGAVAVRDGYIERIVERSEIPPGAPLEDHADFPILPGLVDVHVHVNEPGRTEWEGFETATRAAAAGGVTTIVDMPLNSSPVTTTVAALEAKLAAARGKIRVDCGFWGGLVPGNAADLEPLVDAGVLGFKAFMVHSGIDEFPAAGEPELREGMRVCARRGVPLLAHAELQSEGPPPHPLPSGGGQVGAARKYATWLASRPRRWESEAIRLLASLARETGCDAHVV